MTSTLLLTIASITALAVIYICWYFISPAGNLIDEKMLSEFPISQNKLAYEKSSLDINIKKLDELLIIEQHEIGRMLIIDQLGVMRRYSNVLAVRIALSGTKL